MEQGKRVDQKRGAQNQQVAEQSQTCFGEKSPIKQKSIKNNSCIGHEEKNKFIKNTFIRGTNIQNHCIQRPEYLHNMEGKERS